jgi:hypothetical protein
LYYQRSSPRHLCWAGYTIFGLPHDKFLRPTPLAAVIQVIVKILQMLSRIAWTATMRQGDVGAKSKRRSER